jgi:hypothetical protein
MVKLLVVMIALLGLSPFASAQTTAPTSRPVRIMGTLARVDGSNLFIQRQGGGPEAAVAVDDNTDIRIDGDAAELADLEPGMDVTTMRVPLRGGAGKLVVAAWTRGLSGLVTKVDGKSVVMRAASRGGAETTVETDGHTKVIFVGAVASGTAIKPHEGQIADLKPAMKIKVVPMEGVAKKIFVSPIPDRRPPTSAPAR